jgi:hypothetical protein
MSSLGQKKLQASMPMHIMYTTIMVYLHVASSMNYIISVFLFYVHTDALQYEDMGQQTNAPTFKYLQHKKPN